jgi:hypothetical protein
MPAKDIDVSMGGFELIFKPSERELPAHLDGWTLYDVYIERRVRGTRCGHRVAI